MKRTLRIALGLVLLLPVSSINGVAGYLYVFGGWTGSALSKGLERAIESEPTEIDADFNVKTQDDTIHFEPKSAWHGLRFIIKSKAGRFGLFLIVLSLLQFAAGICLLLQREAGVMLFSFLILVGALGVAAELLSANTIFNFFRAFCFGASIALMIQAYFLRRFSETPA